MISAVLDPVSSPVVSRARGDWHLLHATVRRRFAILPAAERRLLQLRFEQGLSIRQLADITGDNRTGVHRRLTALVERLSDPLLASLADNPGALTPQQWQIAIRALLAGHSIRRICEDLGTDRVHAAAAVAAAETWCIAQARQAARIHEHKPAFGRLSHSLLLAAHN